MIIISACLAGLETRYDGMHNRMESIEKLVSEGKAMLICPEQLGGLPTPRLPAEIVGGNGEDVLNGRAKVIDSGGNDVTKEFIKGAEQALKVAKSVGATQAILKESSPSCGSSLIYNGAFSRAETDGFGVTTALLRRHGIEVRSELNL
jgi:uncharacterized protein YbbK (DUF523 family)